MCSRAAPFMSELQDPEIFRTVLDTLQTGVSVTDRNGRILFWNQGAERVTGHKRHEVVGRGCRDNILIHLTTRVVLLATLPVPLAILCRRASRRMRRCNCAIKRAIPCTYEC